MTKQELKREIQALHPKKVRLNIKETAEVIGKHPNRVPEYMRDYPSEKFGNGRYYFISDIAERLYEGAQYGH